MKGKRAHIVFNKKLKEYLLTFTKHGIGALSLKITDTSTTTLGNTLRDKKALTDELFFKILDFVFKKISLESLQEKLIILEKLNDILKYIEHKTLKTSDIIFIRRKLKDVKVLKKETLVLAVHKKCLVIIPKTNDLEITSGVLSLLGKNAYLKDLLLDIEKAQKSFRNIGTELETLKKENSRKLTLENSYIDFDSFIEERTQNFVGREKLNAKLKTFIKKNDSGYFILSGKPGMGKSAFFSLLSKEEDIHHFINHDNDGKNTERDVIENILYRIQKKYSLNVQEEFQNLLNKRFLFKPVLKKISKSLSQTQKSIIIIDGVDELNKFDDLKKGSNLFTLPRILPKGVFVLLSIRSRKDLPLKAMVEKHIELYPESKENHDDIIAYIKLFINKSGIQNFIKKNNFSNAGFIEELSKKSEGNFMYLHCVIPQIENGYYKNLDFKDIPKGLDLYYEDHWDRIKGKDNSTWFEYKLPIISMITLSNMSLSLEMIRDYARLPKTAMVVAVLEEWNQFFFKKYVGPEYLNIILYKLYHSSFKDFLEKKAEIGAEKIDIRRFVKDFIIKNQKLYSNETTADDILEFHKNLKGDLRAE